MIWGIGVQVSYQERWWEKEVLLQAGEAEGQALRARRGVVWRGLGLAHIPLCFGDSLSTLLSPSWSGQIPSPSLLCLGLCNWKPC